MGFRKMQRRGIHFKWLNVMICTLSWKSVSICIHRLLRPGLELLIKSFSGITLHEISHATLPFNISRPAAFSYIKLMAFRGMPIEGDCHRVPTVICKLGSECIVVNKVLSGINYIKRKHDTLWKSPSGFTYKINHGDPMTIAISIFWSVMIVCRIMPQHVKSWMS